LSDFNDTWIVLTDFLKILQYQISWKSVQWKLSCTMQMDGQMDMKKLIVASQNFVKAPKTIKRAMNSDWLDHRHDTEIHNTCI